MVRLMGGVLSNEGRVEVYCSGEWGTVCNDTFSLTPGNTVCKQLGYDFSNTVNYQTMCVYKLLIIITL